MPIGVQATNEVQEIEPPVLEEIEEPINSLNPLDKQTIQEEDKEIKTEASTIPH